ncbi:MAG: 23S rRNA (uridine(2552)-2'-O)-methyltransferase RlmE [Gammaproteobacteria bacterium]
MARKSSSKRWLKRQAADPFVRRAQAEGWRSRAVFKLMEIDERESLLRPGMTCIDLGAAPGSWSQLVAQKNKGQGRVIAVDLLEMDAIPDVDYIRGDFNDENTFNQLMSLTGERSVDLVLSDIAPNITGMRSVDQPRAMGLAELALDLAKRVLKPNGAFVCKLFHGEGFDDYVRDVRQTFQTVKVRKPESSRPGSRETYLVARTYRI